MANHVLASLFRIEDELEQLGIVGRDVGPDGMESKRFGFDLFLVDAAGGYGDAMAARLQADRKSEVRMQVAERSKRGNEDLFRAHDLEYSHSYEACTTVVRSWRPDGADHR